jgi:uncharacterized protein (TIGR02246 family)
MTAEVRELYTSLLNYWNDMDAAGYADCFADDGNMVGFDGSVINGRNDICDHLAGVFVDHRVARYVAKVREVRELAPGTILLRAVAGMVPPSIGDIKPELNAVQSMIAVRQDEGWRVALFHNTPAAFHGRPGETEALSTELRQLHRRGRDVS